MRLLTVAGLSADGRTLLLSGGGETFAVAVSDMHAAEQIRLPDLSEPAAPAPTPREIQRRIRYGESAADIARTSGAPVEAVARYEGPALAEREHQAAVGRACEVDGRVVQDLVGEHMARVGQPGEVGWDSFMVEPGRWELRAVAGREQLRLRWDPRSRRVSALDEPGRQALRLGPIAEDALGAVLRPLAARPQQAAPERPLPASPQQAAPERPLVAGRKGRAQVPGWDQISMGVQDRGRPRVTPSDATSGSAATASPTATPAAEQGP